MESQYGKTDAFPLIDHRLRTYQREAHAALRAGWRKGHKKLLLELPTGTGKTRTFTLLPRSGARTLVIVPLISLIGQTVKTIRELRDCEADIEQADLWAIPESEFVVASWDTLKRNDRWKRFVGKVDLIVVDEAHHNFTLQAKEILGGLVEGGGRVLGCTATAYRADKLSLLGFYDELSYCYPLRQAIDDGYLCPPRMKVHYVKSVNIDKIAKKAAADFNGEELDRILRSERALQEMAGIIKDQHVPGAKGMVFTHSVLQATMLRELLVDRYGIDTSLVHSYQNAETFHDELKAFTHGDRELVVNVGTLTTGWDFPPVSEVFIGKLTKALNKYTQMIGRGTRVLPGVIDGLHTAKERKAAIAASAKPHFTIHDLADSGRCHQLCSAVDVFAAEKLNKKARSQVRDRLPKEASLEEIDQAVADEMKAEAETRRLEREAERKRRQRLVMGIEFGTEDHDPFSEAKVKVRTWRMPFGKYTGTPLSSNLIPTSYLQWMLTGANLNSKWREAISGEVKRREEASF